MQYLKDLPEVSSIGVNGDLIDIELDQKIDSLPGLRGERVILIAKSGNQITVVVGHIIEWENIEGGMPEVFCRIKMKGSIVEFNAV